MHLMTEVKVSHVLQGATIEARTCPVMRTRWDIDEALRICVRVRQFRSINLTANTHM